MHSSLVKTLLLLTLCISSAVGAPISPSESNLAHDTGDKNVKSNAPIADNAVVNDNVLSHPNKFGTLAANGFSTSPKATQTLGNPRCHVSGGCPKCTHVLPRHGKADAATGPFQAKALGTNHLETRDSPDRRRGIAAANVTNTVPIAKNQGKDPGAIVLDTAYSAIRDRSLVNVYPIIVQTAHPIIHVDRIRKSWKSLARRKENKSKLGRQIQRT
ncbi:hypothetical protein MCOR02_010783 [Pyricularia oryzae]|uniref:Uncharacterized protein n=2 Tax=Pyricularia TaxID=48558 RepID=A0ABQ8NVN1_PYRGI|nr:hypothetical protein MCOR02_010783 [Pyricularia oryzae]KAI6302239.1 hypothetical protein MCOR33_002421 [Pyricularia grisea]KAI6263819.1 hypothetical protein MCOR19_000150 [Pyricularia oryzae]KAI6272636.1 hypothetical protein MCOR26_007268 [Pyricularia oryzae]KAI6322560.1 hypothetical protein MCOR34_002191 [Pyricularia oryzae]